MEFVEAQSALVLGGSGFLGSHVADYLSSKGLEVSVFDQVTSPYLQKSQNMILGSILDAKLLKDIVPEFDYVLNFAAVSDLSEAKEDPIRATQANVIGNLNLLEAMKAQPPKRFMFASTYYVYSEFGSIYRVTKQSCELFIEDYAKRFGLDHTILRYGSLYGDRAPEANTILKLVKQAIQEGKMIRNGDGEEVRDYIHVRDAAESTFDVMMDSKFRNSHVILAGPQQIKIRDLLELISSVSGRKIDIEYKPVPQNDTDHYKKTPYTFRPKVAQRYMPKAFHDLGQGILQMMYEIQENPEKTV